MNTSYPSASLTFYDDKIVVEDVNSVHNDREVMMDWEDPIMSASAAYVTEGGGDILEIGFGMGIASDYIQSHSISSHTIVENHPQIIERANAWASGKSNVTIVAQNWYDVKDSLGKFDGIFYDTYGDDNMVHFAESLSALTKSGTKVTFWNNSYSAMNGYNISDITYQSINVTPPSNSYFTNSVYYMPKKEF